MKKFVFVCQTNEGSRSANGHPVVMLTPEDDKEVWRDRAVGGIEFVATADGFVNEFEQNRRYEVSFRKLSDVEPAAEDPVPDPNQKDEPEPIPAVEVPKKTTKKPTSGRSKTRSGTKG